MSRCLACVLAISGAILGTVAQGAIIQTNSAQTTAYGVASNDLLQTSLAGPPTSVGNFTAEGAGGVPVLNDGLFGVLQAAPPNNTGAATGGNTGGTQVT